MIPCEKADNVNNVYLKYEYVDSLPSRYYRKVEWNNTWSKQGEENDEAAIFSYDELTDQPQSLVNKDFTFEDESGFFGK